MLLVGDDWAEAQHDIEVQDVEGRVLVRRRLREGVDGLAEFHAVVAEHLGEDEDPSQVLIGIETDRGPWPQALIAAGYTVYPINPLRVARYRERHGTSGGKSDKGDAHVLAEIVRLDRSHHRPAAGDSDVAEAVKLAARAHQTMIWTRQRTVNMLRSTLREFYPAALVAFDDLADRDALAVLAIAPSPAQGAALTSARVERALRRGGRQRYVAARATAIVTALRSPQLPVRPGLIAAYTTNVSALVTVVTTMVQQTQVVEEQVAAGFGQHPDAEIYLSQPGLGAILAPRVLAEFGDDPYRYADARARKNYAGTSPITKASGTKKVVLARFVRNRRLADALHHQALCALTSSSGARAYYDRQRAANVGHHKALRALSNRLVGILHGCLRHRTTYNEATAWAHTTSLAA